MSGYVVKVRGAVGSAKVREYVCDHCGRFEERVPDPPPDTVTCPECLEQAERVTSAVSMHTQFVVTASRGPNDKIPKGSPDFMKLGEGQSRKEWREERRRFWREHDYKRRKAALE